MCSFGQADQDITGYYSLIKDDEDHFLFGISLLYDAILFLL